MISSCPMPRIPQMSLQCTVSVADSIGFSFPPYPGTIEDNCRDVALQWRITFYEEMTKFMTCNGLSPEDVICVVNGTKVLDFDIYNAIATIGYDLFQDGKLDKSFVNALQKVIDVNNDIVDKIFPKCHVQKITNKKFEL